MKNWIVPALLLAALFAATRLPALELQAVDTDVNLYGQYAAEFQAAGQQDVSFYELHRQRVEERMRHATPAQAAALAEYRSVEYPPLAVTLMTVPAWLIDAPFDEEQGTGRQPRYARAYTWLMAGFDCAVLALVVFLVCRLFPLETRFEQFERCLAYCLCTWPLYGVLYSRLDLGVALLVIAALALLVSQVHWSLSLALLAVAIHFKLMPVVLAPLWIIASLPAGALHGSWRETVRGVAVRTGVLAGFGLAILMPYAIQDGPAVLEFLGYHRERGIEIESTWASLLLPFKYFGQAWEVYHSHGSVNVRSPLSPLVAGLAMPVLAGLLAAATGMFVAVVRNKGTGPVVRSTLRAVLATGPVPFFFAAAKKTDNLTIAQCWPRLVAAFAMLLLLISIVANKVFSPQYLLWVLPLVPLVDFGARGRRLFFAGMFAVCFLTMRIFPDCFVGEIVWASSSTGELQVFEGPTLYGAFLLIARNSLCVVLMGVLAARCKSASPKSEIRNPKSETNPKPKMQMT